MSRVDAATLQAMVPDGWLSPFFGWHLGLDWSNYLPAVNDKIAADGFSLFGLFFMMMLFKGVFAAMAGPAPNYDMQKVLSTRNSAEAAKMSGFVSVVLLMPRYFMIGGFTVLMVVFFQRGLPRDGQQHRLRESVAAGDQAVCARGFAGIAAGRIVRRVHGDVRFDRQRRARLSHQRRVSCVTSIPKPPARD